jgi:hypothetical protein
VEYSAGEGPANRRWDKIRSLPVPIQLNLASFAKFNVELRIPPKAENYSKSLVAKQSLSGFESQARLLYFVPQLDSIDKLP